MLGDFNQEMEAALAKLQGATGAAAAVQTLSTLLSNLIKDPLNEKFKKIRTTNKKIKETVMDVAGGFVAIAALQR